MGGEGRGAPARHSTTTDHPRRPPPTAGPSPGSQTGGAQAAGGRRLRGAPRVRARRGRAACYPPQLGRGRGAAGAMAGATDPFYLVKDDIHASVRAAGLPTAAGPVPASKCRAGPLSRNPALALCCVSKCLTRGSPAGQLEKAQGQYARWQSLGKLHPERRKLHGDIEDECKSIAWQVRRPLARLCAEARAG